MRFPDRFRLLFFSAIVMISALGACREEASLVPADDTPEKPASRATEPSPDDARRQVIQSEIAELRIRTQPSRAAVYLEGNFVGLSGSAEDLLGLRLPVGTHEIRISAPGHYDFALQGELKPGSHLELDLKLIADGKPWAAPAFAPRLGLSQYVRAKIPAAGKPLEYIIEGKPGLDIYLMSQGDLLRLEVIAPDGKPIPVAKAERLTSLSGREFYGFQFSQAGEHRLRIHPAKPARASEVRLRYLKAAPPKEQGSRRHLAPNEER